MYAIETAKMSSKGQLVVPEAFRRRYGWRQGMTLMLVGVNSGVLLQSLPQPNVAEVEESIAESSEASTMMKTRLEKMKRSLDRIASLGVSLPLDIESGERRLELLRERHS